MLGALGILLNLNDPGWGRSGGKGGAKDPEGSGQDSSNQKPTPPRQDGPPDLDELDRKSVV